MVCKQQPARFALLRRQRLQAHLAGGSLRAVRRMFVYLYVQHRAAHAQFAAQRAAKVRPCIGCRLQTVMNMQRVQGKTQRATGAGEQMQQGDGVHTARECQIHARAARNARRRQCIEHGAKEQGIGVVGVCHGRQGFRRLRRP